jgi:hypothetical protein
MDVLPRAMRQSVTRIRITGSGEDAYGNVSSSTTTSTTITGVSLQPFTGGAPSSETPGSNFDRTVTRWRLFAPPGTDLQTDDRIRQGALDLEIDGEPVTWPGPNGSPHHLEAQLKRFGG